MKQNLKQMKKWQIAVLSALTIAVVILIVALFISAVQQTKELSAPAEDAAATVVTTAPTEAEVPETTVPEETEATETIEETEPTVPEATEPVMLADMAEYYAQNPEIAGWVWIPDTKLNYPVMYTPEDPEKYLHLSFEETYNVGGVPFLDTDCQLDPESDNLIIYGHNMNNGTQFRSLIPQI